MDVKWISTLTLTVLALVSLASTIGSASQLKILSSENIQLTESGTESSNVRPIKQDTVSSSSNSFDNSGMVIISTMDGKVSALEESKGTLLWSVDTGLGPLLSSSITKLQIKQNGKIIRLLPSLSGQLFKFDGNSVEPLPFSAEQLLSSSYKICDGSILVGDNEVTSFGIDATHGRIVYFCTATECEHVTKAAPKSRIIVIIRHQKLVRSVDVRNGQEKWNFSVGNIDLDISEESGSLLVPVLQQSDSVEYFDKHGRNGFAISQGWREEYDETLYQTVGDKRRDACVKVELKISVPDGLLSAYSCESGYQQSWKYKFSSPIASAWHVDGSVIRKVDLFDPETIPALREQNHITVKDEGIIYLGFYENLAYIQTSLKMNKKSGSAFSVVDHLYRGEKKMQRYPIIFSFHPYLTTSKRISEVLEGEAKEGELAISKPSDASGSCSDAADMYVDTSKGKTAEIGYYFKRSLFHPLLSTERGRKGTDLNAGDVLLGSFRVGALNPNLLDWWKEVIFISFVISFLIHIICSKIVRNSKIAVESPTTVIERICEPGAAVFQSRYFLDFEPIRCLGKGGFGIVLESRHKVDARSYAIKRIRLPNKESARDKVLREVRALANLNHHCIVRYFNAWIEEPPAGWLVKIDKDFIEKSSFPSTTHIDSQRSVSRDISSQQQTQDGHSKFDVSSKSQSISTSNAATQPFSFTTMGVQASNDWLSQDFSNISWPRYSFPHSSTELIASSCGKNVPFGRYGREKEGSLSIVFEKSNIQPSTDSAIEEDCLDKHENQLYSCKCSPQSSSEHDSFTTVTAIGNQKSPLGPPRIYLYIQMELCQRESLHSWLTNNQERQNQFCLTIFGQVLSAVQYVHDCNLIHRDLKVSLTQQRNSFFLSRSTIILQPSNIFFSSDGLIKVGDFGLVTASGSLCNEEINDHEGLSKDCGEKRSSHTQKVGTRLYMAPEQMHSCSYSQKVDIFALGLILIELFTIFSTQMERVNTLMESRNGCLPQIFVAVYNGEAKLARRMLSKKPSDRPTASEALRDSIFKV